MLKNLCAGSYVLPTWPPLSSCFQLSLYWRLRTHFCTWPAPVMGCRELKFQYTLRWILTVPRSVLGLMCGTSRTHRCAAVPRVRRGSLSRRRGPGSRRALRPSSRGSPPQRRPLLRTLELQPRVALHVWKTTTRHYIVTRSLVVDVDCMCHWGKVGILV